MKWCKIVKPEEINEEVLIELSKKLEEMRRGEKILSPVVEIAPFMDERKFEAYLSKIEEYKAAAKKHLEMRSLPTATLYACCAALAILMIAKPIKAANFLSNFIKKAGRKQEVKSHPMFHYTLLLLKAVAYNNKEFVDEAKKVFWDVVFINREDRQFAENVLRYVEKYLLKP